MKNSRMNFFAGLMVLALLVVGAAGAFAQGAITLSPVLDTDTQILGANAPANSQVEIFKVDPAGDISMGIVQANGSGFFGLGGLTISENDTFYALVQESWYFESAGNQEAWNDNSPGGAGGSVSVNSGVLSYTVADPVQNPSILQTALGHNSVGVPQSSVGHPADSLRVLEFRLRNPGTMSQIAVSTNNGVSVFSSDNYPVPSGSTNWNTIVLPIAETGGKLAPGTTNFGIYLQFIGATSSDVIEFDYVRVREYVDWHFENGDTMGWGVNLGFSGGLSVVNGVLTAAADGGDRIIHGQPPYPFNNVYDESVFTVLEVSNSSSGAGFWGSQYTWSDADGAFSGQNTVAGVPDGSGAENVIEHNLLSPLGGVDFGNWGPDVNSSMLYQIGGMANGDTFAVDYLRLRPAIYYGPSATVIAAKNVVDPATVSKDGADGADFDNLTAAIAWANTIPGPNNIQVLDSSIYAEDFPAVTESVNITVAAGETPTFDKNANTNGSIAFSFDPGVDNSGIMAISGASSTTKATITSSISSSKPLVNTGGTTHSAVLVLNNLVLSRPTSGNGSVGDYVAITNTIATTQTHVINSVDFVGGDGANQNKPTVKIAPTDVLNVLMTDCDFTQVNGRFRVLDIDATSSATITVQDSKLGQAARDVSGFDGESMIRIANNNFAFFGPTVLIDNCEIVGGVSDGNNSCSPIGLFTDGDIDIQGTLIQYATNNALLNLSGTIFTDFTMTSCSVLAATGQESPIIGGFSKGFYVFDDCEFDTGGATFSYLIGSPYFNFGTQPGVYNLSGAAWNIGVFTFNRPTFRTIGAIAVRPQPFMSVTINGTPENKVSLDEAYGNGLVFFASDPAQGLGGTINLTDVTASGANKVLFQAFGPNVPFTSGTIAGDTALNMESCEWLDGAGKIQVSPNVSALSTGTLEVNASNTIWANTAGAANGMDNVISIYGEQPNPSTVTLNHCTIMGDLASTASSVLLDTFDNGSSGRVDQLIANNSIFDESGAAGVTFNFGDDTGNLTGAGNLYTTVNGVAFGSITSGFGSATTLAALDLSATGRIQSRSSSAFDRAVNSLATRDIDGNSRPLGAVNDIGASELDPPTSAEGWMLY